MLIETRWLAIAEQNMAGARAVSEASPRSSVSRAYYAAYSAAHALLIHLGEEPPERGNWSHEVLPQALAATLSRGTGSSHTYNTVRLRLIECYNDRIQADYGPMCVVDGTSANKSCRAAGQVVALAHRMIGEQNAA